MRMLLLFSVLASALWGTACQPTIEAGASLTLTLLYTGDEHGWMEPRRLTGGAAGLLGLWSALPGFETNTLILSGGDLWTGPDVSTWHQGASMIEVMNAMGYDAAALGNHEFDFGFDRLQERMAEADFPLLSANIRHKDDGGLPGFIQPYTIMNLNGLRVGVIGLSRVNTPQVTHPEHVSEFEFIPYTDALRQVAPSLKVAGAELLIVISHLCLRELSGLVSVALELGVVMLGGGHCNELRAMTHRGVVLVSGGSYLQSYVKVDLSIDAATKRVLDVTFSTHTNVGGGPDPQVAAIVTHWRARTDEALSEVVGFVEQDIPNRSDAMMNLLTDTWLDAVPTADVALTNRGGFRQDIQAGPITRGTVLGVLPFDNVIIEVEVSGAELIENITCCNPAVAGMTTRNGFRLADGTPIDPYDTYRVLINDFMFAGGDGFRFIRVRHRNTYIDWRQPLLDRLAVLNTSPERPLNQFLDPTARSGPRTIPQERE